VDTKNSVKNQNITTFFNIATSYIKKGELEKAIKYFERILSIDPENLKVLYKLSNIYVELTQYDKAIETYEKIKKITDKPIVKVVVTHYHADHIYGLQVFKELGAEIIAPDGVYEYIDSEGATSRLEERRFSLDPWVMTKRL